MLGAIKNLLCVLATCLPHFFKWREKCKREKVEQAVVSGDKETVNRALKDKLGCAFFAVALGVLCCGCSTYTVVASDREVTPMVSESGVKGWFVPDAVMIDILNKLGE